MLRRRCFSPDPPPIPPPGPLQPPQRRPGPRRPPRFYRPDVNPPCPRQDTLTHARSVPALPAYQQIVTWTQLATCIHENQKNCAGVLRSRHGKPPIVVGPCRLSPSLHLVARTYHVCMYVVARTFVRPCHFSPWRTRSTRCGRATVRQDAGHLDSARAGGAVAARRAVVLRSYHNRISHWFSPHVRRRGSFNYTSSSQIIY